MHYKDVPVIHLNNIGENEIDRQQQRFKSDYDVTLKRLNNTHRNSGDSTLSQSFHEPFLKNKNIDIKSPFRKATFAAYGLHPRRTSYQHNLSDKFSKKRVERLNFELKINEVKHRETWNKRNNWFGTKIDARGLSKWCICLYIGIFTGLCMFLVSICIEILIDINLTWTLEGLKRSFMVGFTRFLGVNCLFAFISGSMVSYIAPSAAGSGIPSVKGWLNGSAIPGLFEMKTLVVKLIGIIFSVSAKFIIGKEGPMVHAGAAFASGTLCGGNKTLLPHSFRNDLDSRDLISCGAAAGVAAAFGAPIGGMLFALEEVASFWLPRLTWRVFFTAAVSNLILTMLLGCWDGNCGTASKSSLISFERSVSIVGGTYNLIEFCFFIIMGLVGGLIGAAFNHINVKICLWRKKYLKKRSLRLSEVLLMAVITTTLLIATPLILPCKKVPIMNDNALFTSSFTSNSTCYDVVTSVSAQYTCDDGYYNPLSTLLLQSSENVIKGLFMFESTCWEPIALWLSALIYFVLAVTTYGVSIPSGLFIPLILIGSNVGHVIGGYWASWFKDSFDVGTYALIGASAVLGGSTRMTISLTAIIMEITNDIYFLMPIMITIMVSKWVGDQLNSALYDAHVLLKDIPYLEAKISSFVPSYICAEDIMRPMVVTLPSVVDLKSLLNILNDPNNHHQAFPVIDMRNKSVKWLADHGWDQKEGNYIGMILRWHIYIMLHHKCFSELNDPTFKYYKPPILALYDLTDRKWKNKNTISAQECGISESELSQRYIDLTPYMSLSPVTVCRCTTVLQLYNIFKGIGLRHLVVIGNKRQIVGMITTHELNEEDLEHAVQRVHHYFENKSESEQNELFEQRISFLKGITKRLMTSGNRWLFDHADAPNAHGRRDNIIDRASTPSIQTQIMSDGVYEDNKSDIQIDTDIDDPEREPIYEDN